MSHFTASDGTALFYRDQGRGHPIVFVGSWGLDSRMWGRFMLHFAARGFRCIAMDRRGHGRSDDPGRGYDDYDRLADDLGELLAHLDLREAVLVAHSMGTGECTRYLQRHGSARVARMVYLGTLAPSYVDGSRDPRTLDDASCEAVLEALRRDAPAWLRANADGFFLPAKTGTSEETVRHTIGMILETSLQALVECFRVKRIDQRAALRAIDVPLLVIHGDRDVSEPVHQGRATAELVPGCRYLEYPGAAHGFYHTHFEQLAADIGTFVGIPAPGAATAGMMTA